MLHCKWACYCWALAVFGTFSAPALAQPCGVGQFACDDSDESDSNCLPDVSLVCDGEEVMTTIARTARHPRGTAP